MAELAAARAFSFVSHIEFVATSGWRQLNVWFFWNFGIRGLMKRNVGRRAGGRGTTGELSRAAQCISRFEVLAGNLQFTATQR